MAGVLFAMLAAGCQGPAGEASSYTGEPALTAPSSSEELRPATSSSSADAVSSLPLPVRPEAAFGELTLEDFAVYLGGAKQLDLESVTLYRFSFAGNAEDNRLDPRYITTLRGLSLGAEQQEIAFLYEGLPVQVVLEGEGTEETQTLQYESFSDYLESDEAGQDYSVVFSLYFIEGAPEGDAQIIQNAIAANAYGPQYSMVRYDLRLEVRQGKVEDILLSKNDTTPFVLGQIEPAVCEEGDLTVSVAGLSNQQGALCVGLALQNNGELPLQLACTQTTVSGKATRDPGVLEIEMPAWGYAEALLVIPSDAIRAAGVDTVESVGFTLQAAGENGEVLFELSSGNIPVITS
ncbi:hypothetical protein LJC49_10655 [Ruminococcaceae bacterium OttesenSCG-928-I18]|nr:hypothetical protein [Ruminococcaceae bacterium OttesenSCG-928-I18]